MRNAVREQQPVNQTPAALSMQAEVAALEGALCRLQPYLCLSILTAIAG